MMKPTEEKPRRIGLFDVDESTRSLMDKENSTSNRRAFDVEKSTNRGGSIGVEST